MEVINTIVKFLLGFQINFIIVTKCIIYKKIRQKFGFHKSRVVGLYEGEMKITATNMKINFPFGFYLFNDARYS